MIFCGSPCISFTFDVVACVTNLLLLIGIILVYLNKFQQSISKVDAQFIFFTELLPICIDIFGLFEPKCVYVTNYCNVAPNMTNENSRGYITTICENVHTIFKLLLSSFLENKRNPNL